jgi:hypothetical protein
MAWMKVSELKQMFKKIPVILVKFSKVFWSVAELNKKLQNYTKFYDG